MLQFLECGQQICYRSAPTVQPPNQHYIDLSATPGSRPSTYAWGVRQEAALAQRTMEIRLAEILKPLSARNPKHSTNFNQHYTFGTPTHFCEDQDVPDQ
jgi:hypothetical protein